MPNTLETESKAVTLKNWLLKVGRLKFQPKGYTPKSLPPFQLLWMKKAAKK